MMICGIVIFTTKVCKTSTRVSCRMEAERGGGWMQRDVELFSKRLGDSIKQDKFRLSSLGRKRGWLSIINVFTLFRQWQLIDFLRRDLFTFPPCFHSTKYAGSAFQRLYGFSSLSFWLSNFSFWQALPDTIIFDATVAKKTWNYAWYSFLFSSLFLLKLHYTTSSIFFWQLLSPRSEPNLVR